MIFFWSLAEINLDAICKVGRLIQAMRCRRVDQLEGNFVRDSCIEKQNTRRKGDREDE